MHLCQRGEQLFVRFADHKSHPRHLSRQPAVSFEHFARDEHGVDVARMGMHDDGGDGVIDGHRIDVVEPN